MKLQRPLVFLDTETTGVDPLEDRVICLAVERWWPNFGNGAHPMCCEWEVHPMRDIPPEASAVHGYTNESVANFPRFSEVVQAITPWLSNCDVAGFNLSKFDLTILQKEFQWASAPWPMTNARVVDVMTMYFKLSPRNLTAAVREYCGRAHEDAHGATADNKATSDVLAGMLAKHPELTSMEVVELSEYCKEVKAADGQTAMTVDIEGKLIRMPNGDICYNFGKDKGAVIKDKPGFAIWMLKQAWVPDPTKQLLRELLGKPAPR